MSPWTDWCVWLYAALHMHVHVYSLMHVYLIIMCLCGTTVLQELAFRDKPWQIMKSLKRTGQWLPISLLLARLLPQHCRRASVSRRTI